MKKIKTFTTSLFIGLFSSTVFANEISTQPVAQTTAQPVTQVAIQQVPAEQSMQTVVTPQQVVVDPNSVNINTASAAEIQDKLVGIGAKKAQAIVDYRTKNGNFMSVEQLKEVSGIGEATLEKNRSRIILQ